jgi:hypothetical protein
MGRISKRQQEFSQRVKQRREERRQKWIADHLRQCLCPLCVYRDPPHAPIHSRRTTDADPDQEPA